MRQFSLLAFPDFIHNLVFEVSHVVFKLSFRQLLCACLSYLNHKSRFGCISITNSTSGWLTNGWTTLFVRDKRPSTKAVYFTTLISGSLPVLWSVRQYSCCLECPCSPDPIRWSVLAVQSTGQEQRIERENKTSDMTSPIFDADTVDSFDLKVGCEPIASRKHRVKSIEYLSGTHRSRKRSIWPKRTLFHLWEVPLRLESWVRSECWEHQVSLILHSKPLPLTYKKRFRLDVSSSKFFHHESFAFYVCVMRQLPHEERQESVNAVEIQTVGQQIDNILYSAEIAR